MGVIEEELKLEFAWSQSYHLLPLWILSNCMNYDENLLLRSSSYCMDGSVSDPSQYSSLIIIEYISSGDSLTYIEASCKFIPWFSHRIFDQLHQVWQLHWFYSAKIVWHDNDVLYFWQHIAFGTLVSITTPRTAPTLLPTRIKNTWGTDNLNLVSIIFPS